MDDIESGIGKSSRITPDRLITACRSKYNNMSNKKQWNQVDPRDAQILALTTQVQALESKQKEQAVALATVGDSSRNHRSLLPPPWAPRGPAGALRGERRGRRLGRGGRRRRRDHWGQSSHFDVTKLPTAPALHTLIFPECLEWLSILGSQSLQRITAASQRVERRVETLLSELGTVMANARPFVWTGGLLVSC